MKVLGFLMCVVSVAIVACPESVAQTTDLENRSDGRKLPDRHKAVQQVAESMRFHREIDGRREPVELVKRPVLRYADTPRTDKDGAVWVVGAEGRPLGMMVVYTKSGFSPGHWIRAVTSLCPSNTLRGTTKDRISWSPNGAGVTMQPLPGDVPSTSSRTKRLSQMKQLVRRFSGHEFWPADSRHELRLLVKPLHRYEDTEAGILDGAVFALAHDLNPEAFVIVEAHDTSVGPAWNYAIARFGFAELHVEMDNKEVWQRAIISSTAPTEPYWLFHLRM